MTTNRGMKAERNSSSTLASATGRGRAGGDRRDGRGAAEYLAHRSFRQRGYDQRAAAVGGESGGPGQGRAVPAGGVPRLAAPGARHLAQAVGLALLAFGLAPADHLARGVNVFKVEALVDHPA